MSTDEIILVSEKRLIEKFKYKIWPGDEKDTSYEENNFFVSKKPSEAFDLEDNDKTNFLNKSVKRKREANENEEVAVKRPNMKNRYFSVENVEQISGINEKEVKKSNLSESDQFLKRKDYLIKRLLRNRILPGTENVDNEDVITKEQPDSNEIHVNKPARSHQFQQDFIPLFKTDSVEKKESEQNLSLELLSNYYGPYPERCMKRVTETIIDAFKPIKGATYTNRAAEIAKMKVQLPSKFDKDTRLWRRIMRESFQVRQELKDKIERFKRHHHLMNSRKKNKKIFFVDLDENSDVEEVSEKENKKKKKLEKFDESDEETLNDSVIPLESSSDSDMDSKYTQFGKYSKKIKNEKQKKKVMKNKNFSRKNQQESAKSIYNNSKLNKEPSNDENLEMLRQQYRSLRNARNKSMNSIKKNVKDKSSKQISLEIERKLMNEKITKVRRMIKKLAKKNK
ncbi:hypothetical protein BpHYR1_020208, partial [Brachionus plicatilis]